MYNKVKIITPPKDWEPKQLVEVGEAPVVELSITETMDFVDLIVALFLAWKAANEDGKLDWTDVFKLWEPLKKVPAAFTGMELVPAELLNVDLSEAQTVIDEVVKRLNVTAEKAKVIIENAIKAMVHIKNVVEAIV